MGQVIIRNLDDDVIAALKARAAAHGHSLEQELRLLLSAAARPTRVEVRNTAADLRALDDVEITTDLDDLIREDRDR